ncbi:MFS transporter [Parvibaculum sp.]|uniref:MFS transporter n=1 Tax=Parvibaculum sp. TaxID=2024848 RepID=UPI000C987BCB|nr:MFS transporter [Parvibaculum sp.]MAB12403.1 MFS transporter [Parvibaculum sp.]
MADGNALFDLDEEHRLTAVLAGVIGNILEWYDFALYGFMASVLSGLFFPDSNHLVSLIATYGVFAVGFIMRPLGSVVFGWMGDTFGRSRTLILSVAMMAFPTLCLGLLPVYAQAGVYAPLLLVLVRMVQGLSVGGEFSTSVTYLVETAPAGRRGVAGSWANIGSLCGMLLGSGAATAVTSLLTADAMHSWGWRIPFIFGGVLGAIAIVLRRGLPESPHFKRYQSARCRNSPIVEAFSCNRRETVQGVLFASSYGALFYLALVYLPTWVAQVTTIPLDSAMRINTLTLALLIPFIPLAGWISDRFVRRTYLLVGAILAIGGAGVFILPWIVADGGIAALVGQVAMGLFLAVPLGAAPALFTEQFPEDDRLTAYSIVFNTGLGIVGGTTPVLASWLILETGSQLGPLIVLLAAMLSGVTGLIWMRDRSREPLMTQCGISVRHAMSAGREMRERGRCPAYAETQAR